MSQESDQATETRELIAGELAPEEERIPQCLRDLFTAVVEHRVPFQAVIRPVKDRLVAFLRTRRDTATLEAFDVEGLRVAVAAESARLGPDAARKVSPAEEEYCRDVIGVIHYAIRNGLTLSGILGMIVHDLREILDFRDMDEAARGNAVLHCHEYRELVEAPVGVTEPD